jgi:hypothetical protein
MTVHGLVIVVAFRSFEIAAVGIVVEVHQNGVLIPH